MQVTDNKIFAQNLRNLIEKLGVTQKFLALSLSVSEQTIAAWKIGSNIPPARRLKELANFCNERIPGLRLTAERLLHEDLTVDLRLAGKRSLEAEPSYGPAPEPRAEGITTQGLFDLMSDRKTMELMSITQEEIEILKQVRFAPGRFQPTRELYIEMLFHLRKAKEE